MIALLDVNILLDVFLKRDPWFEDSRAVWEACDAGRADGYISAVTLTSIWYLARRTLGRDRAHEAIEQCLNSFRVAPTSRETLQAALEMSGGDFEDNVQIASAITSLSDVIVTRDQVGFGASPIPVVSPQEFLVRLHKTP